VDGALTQTEGAGGGGGRRGDFLLDAGGHPGRGDVDGLLEERTVEPVGFIEQGEDLEAAADQEALEGDLEAGDELFDEDQPGRVSTPVDEIGRLQQGFDAPEGGDGRFGGGRAADAAGGGQ